MTTNISIKLTEGKMNISNVGEQSLNKVIDGFFKALNVEQQQAEVEVKTGVNIKIEEPKAYANAYDPKVAKEIAGVLKKEEPKFEKVVDLVGGNKAMVHNPFKKALGELTEESPLQKYIDRDDIRMVDDIPTYKTEFICPSCETTGKRYIRVDNKYTKCYNCQEKLVVEKVFSDSNEPDNNGYFFFAENIYKGDK